MFMLLALSAPALDMSGHCAERPITPAIQMMAHGDGHHSVPTQPERRDCIGCVLPDLNLIAAPKSHAPTSVVGASSVRPALLLARKRPEVPPPRS